MDSIFFMCLLEQINAKIQMYPFRLLGEYMFLGSVSSQQRFGVIDIKALISESQLSGIGQTV